MVQSLEQMPMASTTASSNVPRGGRVRGFTLIELMVTVAIVAILAAIAYPSYTAYIVRSNRAAAQGYMLELTNLQQRYLLDARTYAKDLATLNITALPSNVAPNYGITFDLTAKAGVTGPVFKIVADPQNSQKARDTACATLTIDETGLKDASGTSGAAGCW